MAKPRNDKPKGILNPHMGEKMFRLARYFPSQALSFFIEHYWIVRWDLRGHEPYIQDTLPHPSVHLVFEQNNSNIYGVITGKFSRHLENNGQVFGIKFRPGAFYPFVQTQVSQFTDVIMPVNAIFGEEICRLESVILSESDDGKMVERAEDFLRAQLPEPDENIALINQIIDHIIADRTIIRVDDVVDQLNIPKRTLQRLFSQYVGVSPKWVIKRYRLHEAADQLAGKQVEDITRMALELGYFDQAHFIKDFKTLIGQPPAAYVRQLA